MVEGSSALAEARKAWRERNSDQKRCMDEAGNLVECYAPPSFVLTDVELSDVGFSEAVRTTTYPADATTTTPVVSDYEAHAVLHTHVFDPALEDPDA